MFRTENALILREVRFKESDRILTVLTADSGKMTLAAHGALSKKSRIAAATQQLIYAELTLFEKNGRYTVREGTVKEDFDGLRWDLARLALGTYIAECLEQYAGEGQPEPELMQLGLNCLYALSKGLADCETIKTAFELRLMAVEGYAPAGENCSICGRKDIQEPMFSLEEGHTVCRNCRKAGETLPLSKNAVTALLYIMNAPAKRILSFHLEEADLHLLGTVSENWLLRCSDRGFQTLVYYKNLINRL